jgi:surfeit locus 1 family protein
MLKRFLTWRWFFITLAVLGGVAACIRLGFWQLDRLAERRALNARVEAQIQAAPLNLNQQIPTAGQLYDMEYRSVTVTGSYDASQELVLVNQVNGDQLGYQVFTPLKIAGSNTVVLVERGWIPPEDGDPAIRQKYAEIGQVTVQGILRRSQDQPNFGGMANPTLAPGAAHLDAWNYINISQVQKQMPYPILSLYIQEAPSADWSGMPVRQMSLPQITEGPHMGYAIQWFLFAAVLAGGYPVFVKRQLGRKAQHNEKRGDKLENPMQAASGK